MKPFFSGKTLQSLIQSEDVTKTERILGYFVGPCLAYAVVNFFQFCFAVMPIIGYSGCAFLMSFYNLKKD